MHSRLVAVLRSRGVPVITVLDAGLAEKTDEEQLAFATERECVLYTFNVPDLHRLHTTWASTGREHAGMILAPQQRFSVGEQIDTTKDQSQGNLRLVGSNGDRAVPSGNAAAHSAAWFENGEPRPAKSLCPRRRAEL